MLSLLGRRTAGRAHAHMRRFCLRAKPGTGIGSIILTFPKKHPLVFGCFFSCLKTGAADVFVQMALEGKSWEEVDRARTAVFFSFGFAYMGFVQYGIYVKLMGQYLWPNAGRFAAKSFQAKLKDPRGIRDLFAQVGFDQAFHMPFLFFPVYYTFKEAILADPAKRQQSGQTVVGAALHKYQTNMWEDLEAAWKVPTHVLHARLAGSVEGTHTCFMLVPKRFALVWIPCNLVNFGFMPMHMRIPFMACCSFGFTALISTMRGAEPVASHDAEALIKMLPQNLSDERLLEWLSKYRTVDGIGITRCTVLAAFAELGYPHTDPEGKALNKLINQVVLDGDESIAYESFAAVAVAILGNGNSERRMKVVFNVIDRDGGGTLSSDELLHTITTCLRLRAGLMTVQLDPFGVNSALTNSPQAGFETPETAAQQQTMIRIKKLPSFGSEPTKLDGLSLKQLLDVEARTLCNQFVADADKDGNNSVSLDEFMGWAKHSKDAGNLLQLFMPFERLTQSEGVIEKNE